MSLTALLLSLIAQLPQQAKIAPAMSFTDNPTTLIQVEVNRAAIAGWEACLAVAQAQFSACMGVVRAFVESSNAQEATRACSAASEKAEDACFERNGLEVPPQTFQRRNAVEHILAEGAACGGRAKRQALECLAGGESQSNCTKTAMAALDVCGVEQRAKITELRIPGEPGTLRAKRREK